ncbi:MAG: hypothetical protein HOP34_04280, partial [Methylococcaceae bacterium]|nr:hypothetical protein [Methylococcaceae bacterium]
TDAGEKRYRFGHQPQIAFWNLGQLANALYPLIEQVEPLRQALDVYTDCFEQGWQTMMADKLGLDAFNPATDEVLLSDLVALLQVVETDMTLFYRHLADVSCAQAQTDDDLIAPLMAAYYVPEQFTAEYKAQLCAWLRAYGKRVQHASIADTVRKARMNAVNPKYVLRNYLAQLAIDKAEQGDFSMLEDLLACLQKPYDEQPEHQVFAEKRPDWARQRPGCSMLSCSS